MVRNIFKKVIVKTTKMRINQKMFRCAIFLVIIKAIICVNSETDSVSEILNFWKIQEDQLILGTKKDIVIFLGDTGSGKSTVISLLTGADLESVETDIGSGAYNILDKIGRVSQNSTVISQTLVPELIVDGESGVVYFDCPGFKDTRGVKYDITITYLIRKLLEFADSVKLVFVINHSSVSTGGDRHGILELAKHANHLIKNIEKFADAIGLVVTKVENGLIARNDDFVLVNDEKIIEGIGKFLEQAEEDLRGLKSKADTSSHDRKINEMGIKFIDILLRKGVNGQSRIGIFRKPLTAGSISDMPLLQSERDAIKRQINRNLKFVERADGDFGYSLSDESKIHATELINGIQIRLVDEISIIGDKIVSHHTQQLVEFFDLDLLPDRISSIHSAYIRTFDKEPYTFLARFLGSLKTNNVAGIIDYTENINKYLKNIDFLIKFTESSILNPVRIADGLNETIEKVGRLQNWYDFLIDLYERISEMNWKAKHMSYNQIKNDAEYLMERCSIVSETQKTNGNGIGLHQFLDRIDIKMNYDIQTMPIDAFQLDALKAVLNATIINKPTCSSSGSTITGFNVKMSDIFEMDCWHRSPILKIFALDKILFDVDFKRTNDGNPKQLSIIAPVWKIMGNRRINLNGENGHFHSSAPNGCRYSKNGKDGRNGISGTSAASFFGVGYEFAGGSMLSILANGGNGSPGQNGGRGFYVNDEEPASVSGAAVALGAAVGLVGAFLGGPFGAGIGAKIGAGIAGALAGGAMTAEGSKSTEIIGMGGNGGAGSFAGSRGDIQIIGLKDEPQFLISSLDGANGGPGKGGHSADKDKHGLNGTIVIGIQNATKITSVQQSTIFNEYKEFAENNMAYNIRRTATKNFIRKYEKSWSTVRIVLIYILCLCSVFVIIKK